MNDRDTTISHLKEQVLALCLRKGWGDNGVQNPQQVAMAMTVEMSEVLEHFQWLDEADVRALLSGSNREAVSLIAEEIADVMMYCLQLCYSLDIDITEEIIRKISIVDARDNGRA